MEIQSINYPPVYTSKGLLIIFICNVAIFNLAYFQTQTYGIFIWISRYIKIFEDLCWLSRENLEFDL